MNALLGGLLSSYLGKYIEPEGLRSINFSFSGEVKLRNLAVRPEALDQIDLPFKLKHGTVGGISLTIPGGLTGFLSKVYTEPIRLRIEDVHVLVDKAPQTPGELARKRAAQQQAALDLDAVAYRQTLIDVLEKALEKAAAELGGGTGSNAAGKGSKAPPGGIAAAIMRNLQIDIVGFHVRYEDSRSQADAPFAFGLTFASFSTFARQEEGAGNGAPASGGSSSIPGIMYRSARLTSLCAYLDPLPLHGEFGKLGPAERTLAFMRGVAGQDGALLQAPHHFLLAPASPVLQLALNLDGRVPAEPAVRASLVLSDLKVVACRRQVASLMFLLAWLEEDRFKQVAKALRAKLRPAGSVRGSTRAWWLYAKDLALGLLRRHRDDSGLKRWDAARVKGALERRRRYISAYRSLVVAEASVIRKGLEAVAAGGGDSSGGGDAAYEKALKDADPSASATIAEMEQALPLECLLEFRAEARFDVEADIEAGRGSVLFGAAGKKGAAASGATGSAGSRGASSRGGSASSGGWFGWLSSGSAPASAGQATAEVGPEQSAADATARADRVRQKFEDAKRGGATAVYMDVQAELYGASLVLERSPGVPLMTVTYGGAAQYRAMRGKAFQARLRLGDVRAIDEVTARSAYRAILLTKAAAAGAAAGGKMLLLDDATAASPSAALMAPATPVSPARSPGAGAFAPSPTASSSSGTPPSSTLAPLLDVFVDAFPLDRPDTDIVIRVATQPLTLVVAPQLLRELGAFANLPESAGAGAEMNARARMIAGQVGSDVYGALAAHTRVDLDARIAGPAILVPDDVTNASCRRLLLNLGELSFTSASATVRTPQQPQAAERTDDVTALVPSAGMSSSPPSFHRRGASAVEDASFDNWRLQIANVAVFLQPAQSAGLPRIAVPPATPVSAAGAALVSSAVYDTDARPKLPVIEPISLDLLLQTCVLPASVAPNRLRVKGRLPRLAVSVSLPFALTVGGLNARLLETLSGVQADTATLQAEYDASYAANKKLEAALEAAAGAAAAGPAIKPSLFSRKSGSSATKAAPTQGKHAAQLSAGVGPYPAKQHHPGKNPSTPTATSRPTAAYSTPLPASPVHSPAGRRAPMTPGGLSTTSTSGGPLASPGTMLATPSAAAAPTGAAGVYVVDFSFDELELRLADVRTSARRMVRKLRRRARENAAGEGEDAEGFADSDDDGSLGGFHTSRSSLSGRGSDAEDNTRSAVAPSSADLVFTMRALRTGVEYSTDGLGLSLSLRSFDVDDHYQRAGKDFQRLIGTGSERDPFATSSGGALALHSSATTATELISVRLTQRTRPDREADEVPLAASLRFSSLHIGYNPETVAALQLYGLYLAECAFGGPSAAGAAHASGAASAPASAAPASPGFSPATAPSVGDEAALPTAEGQASYFAMLESLVAQDSATADGDLEASAGGGQIAPAAGGALAAALCKIRIQAELSEVTLAMHKERLRRKVALLGISGLRAGVEMDVEGGMAVEATLTNVYLRDTCTVNSKYPLLLSVVDDGSGEGGGAKRNLLHLHYASYVKDMPRYPGHDSSVRLSLSPVCAVFLNAPLMEVIDYASSGLLNTLLTSAVATASAAIADTVAAQAEAATRMLLDVSLSQPHVMVPVSATSTAMLSLGIASVRVTNAFAVEEPEAASGDATPVAQVDRTVDQMAVQVTGLSVGTNDGATSATITQGSPSISIQLVRPLSAAYKRQPGMDIAVTIPAIRMALSKAQYTQLLRILDENIGAAAGADAAASGQGGAAAQLAVVPEEEDEDGVRDIDADLQVAYGYGAAPAPAPASAAATDANAAPAPVSTMRARVKLQEDVSLTLNTGTGAGGAADGLVSVALRTIDVGYQVTEEGSTHISFALQAIDVKDIRKVGAPGTLTAEPFRRIIRQRTTAAANSAPGAVSEPTISADVSMTPDGTTGVTIGAGPLQVVAAPHFVQSLLTFLAPPEKPQQLASPTASPHAPAPVMTSPPLGPSQPAASPVPRLSAAGRQHSAGAQLEGLNSSRSRSSSVTDLSAGQGKAGAAQPKPAAVAAAKPTKLHLRAQLRGVSLLVPETASHADSQCLVLRAEASATFSDVETPAGDSDGVTSFVAADATVPSLWAALLRGGQDAPNAQTQYVIRPAAFRGTYTATTRKLPSEDGGAVQRQATERLVSFDADQLTLALGYAGLLRTALGCYKDVQSSGLLGSATAPTAGPAEAPAPPAALASPTPLASPAPQVAAARRRTSVLSTSSGAGAKQALTPSAPVIKTTVTDRVVFGWRGLQVTVLDDLPTSPPPASNPAVAAGITGPKGLVSASIGDVALQVEGVDGLYSLSGNFAITANTWDSTEGDWRPLVLQPWKFDLSVSQAIASETAAALGIDMRAATPLEVVLLDSTLRDLLGGVERWQGAAAEATKLLAGAAAAPSPSTLSPSAPVLATPASDEELATATPPAAARWLSAAREMDLRASISIPVVCVDLVATSVISGVGSGVTPLARLALLQAEVELTTARIVGVEPAPTDQGALALSAGLLGDEQPISAVPRPTIANEVNARIRTSALHAFDLVNAHLPSFGLLLTSTPALHAQLEATGRHGAEAGSSGKADDRARRDAQLKLLVAQQADFERRGGRKLIDIAYSSQTRPEPAPAGLQHPPLPAPYNTTESNTGHALTDIRVGFDVLHIEFNAGTVKKLMRFLSALAPPPAVDAGAGAAATQAGATSPAPAKPALPAALTTPSSFTSTHLGVVIRMLSLSLNKETAAEPRKVAKLAVKVITVGILLRDETGPGARNGNTFINGSMADLSLTDTNTPGTRYSQLISRKSKQLAAAAAAAGANTRSSIGSSSRSLILDDSDSSSGSLPDSILSFEVHSRDVGCDVPAGASVAAFIAPLDVVFLNAQLMEVIDFVLVRLLGALVPAPDLTLNTAIVSQQQEAMAHARKLGRDIPASLVSSLCIEVAGPRVIVPITPLSPEALVITVDNVSIRTTVEDVPADAMPQAGHAHGDAHATTTPANVISILLTSVRADAVVHARGYATSAPLLVPMPELGVTFAQPLLLHESTHVGRRIGVDLAPITLSLSHGGYTVLRAVLDHNLGSKPMTTDDILDACDAMVLRLAPLGHEFDPEAPACGCCGSAFGCALCAPVLGLVSRLSRLRCGMCGRTVCSGCMLVNTSVYDQEARVAFSPCRTCITDLARQRPSDPHLAQLALSAGTLDGPPMAVRVTLPSVSLQIGRESRGDAEAVTPIASLQLRSIGVTFASQPLHGSMTVDVSIGSFSLVNEAPQKLGEDGTEGPAPIVRLLVAPNIRALTGRPESSKGLAASNAENASSAHAQLQLTYSSRSTGDSRVGMVLNGCDINPEMGCLAALGAFFGEYAPSVPAAAAAARGGASDAHSAGGSAHGGDGALPLAARAPPSKMQVDLHLSRPRLLLLRDPCNPHSDAFIATFTGQVRFTSEAGDVTTTTLSLSDPVTSPFQGVTSAGRLVRARQQLSGMEADVKLYELELYRTRLDLGPTLQDGDDPYGADADAGPSLAASGLLSPSATSFGAVSGPRRTILRPINARLGYSGSTVAYTGILQETPIDDPAKCLATRRAPPARTKATLTLETVISLTLTGQDALVLQDVLARYSAPAPAAANADNGGGELDDDNDESVAIVDVTGAADVLGLASLASAGGSVDVTGPANGRLSRAMSSPASSTDSPPPETGSYTQAPKPAAPAAVPLADVLWPLPPGWHPCDYEVTFPPGVQLGLQIREMGFGPAGSDRRRLLTVAVVPQVDVPAGADASSVALPQFDTGSGVRGHLATPAAASGCIVPGDLLVAVNDMSLAEASREQAIALIRGVKGARVLRMRAMPFALAAALDAAGVEVTVVNNLQGRNDEVLRLRLAPANRAAMGSGENESVGNIWLSDDERSLWANAWTFRGDFASFDVREPVLEDVYPAPGAGSGSTATHSTALSQVDDPVTLAVQQHARARRPALGSFFAQLHATLAVDVYRSGGGPAEPLLEPVSLALEAVMVDAYHKTDALKKAVAARGRGGFRRVERPLRAVFVSTTRVELNAALEFMRPLLTAAASWEASQRRDGGPGVAEARMEHDLSLVAEDAVPRTLSRMDAPTGSAMLMSSSPPGIFPYILRNKTGVRLAVEVQGMDREVMALLSRATAAGVQFQGAAGRSIRALSTFGGLEASGASSEQAIDPNDQFANEAVAADAVLVPDGAELGFALAARKHEFGQQRMETVAAAAASAAASAAAARHQEHVARHNTRSVDIRLENGREALRGIGIDFPGHGSKPISVRDSHTQAVISVSVDVADGRRIITLRSQSHVKNLTAVDMQVYVTLPGSYEPVYVGHAAAGGALAIPLSFAGATGVRVRPVPIEGVSGAYTLSQPIPLTGSETGEVRCGARPLPAAPGAPLPASLPPYHFVTRVAPRRRGAYYTISLHAPMRVTNLLPLRARFRFTGGGEESEAVYLPPGGSTDVYSVGGTGLVGSRYRDDGSRAPASASSPVRVHVGLDGLADTWSDGKELSCSRGDETIVDVALPQSSGGRNGTTAAAANQTTVKLAVIASRPEASHGFETEANSVAGSEAATQDAAAAAAEASAPPSRLDLEVFSPHWILNASGLPLVYGQRRRSGDVYGSEEIVPAGMQGATTQVYEEVWENQRHYGPLVGWRDPGLPTDPPAWADLRSGASSSREEVERRVVRLDGGQWRWLCDWQAGPWDHAFDFSYFKGKSEQQPQSERRGTDNVRRRRWSRVRQLAAVGTMVDTSAEAATWAQPGIFPGSEVRHTAGAPSPRIVSGSPLASAVIVTGAADPSQIVLFSPHEGKLFVRFASGAWSARPVDLSSKEESTVVQGPKLRGKASDGSGFDSTLAYPLAAATEVAPGEFGRRTTVVRLSPHYVLVNATSQPLYYRMAGRGASPIPTSEAYTWPEQELAPFSHAPLWLQAMGDPPCVQFSPAAARGGWSPPVPLPLWDRESDRQKTLSDVPISITLPSRVPYARTMLGVTPTATAVMGLSIRKNESLPGSKLVIITQQSQPYAVLRPPLDTLTGPGAEREFVARCLAEDSDLQSAAEARKRQLVASAAQAASASARGGSARTPGASRGAPSTPLRPASESTGSWGPGLGEDYVAVPYIAIINHSSCVVAYHQKQPRMFDHTGTVMTQDTEDRSYSALHAERSSTRVYGDGSGLGVCYTAAIHYAAPRSVVPVGLVDPEHPESPHVRFTLAAMDTSRGGGSGGMSRDASGGSSFGKARVLNLDHVGKCLYIMTPSGRGVVAQVRITGTTKVIALYDDTPIRAAIGGVVLSAGAGSSAEITRHGDAWRMLDDAATAAAKGDEDGGTDGGLVGEDGSTAADVLALSDPWHFGRDMDVRVATDASLLRPGSGSSAAGSAGPGSSSAPASGSSAGSSPGAPPASSVPAVPTVHIWDDLLRVDVAGVGLSIIDASIPDELFYASFEGITAAVRSGHRDVSYAVSITDGQVDDMDRKAGFPVILGRQRRRPMSTQAKQDAPLVSLTYVESSQHGAKHIKRLAGGITPLRVGLTTEVVFKGWALADKAAKIQRDAVKFTRKATGSSSAAGGPGSRTGVASLAPSAADGIAAEAAAAAALRDVATDRTFAFLQAALDAPASGAAASAGGSSARTSSHGTPRAGATPVAAHVEDRAPPGHAHRPSAFPLGAPTTPVAPAPHGLPRAQSAAGFRPLSYAGSGSGATPMAGPGALPQRDPVALIDALVRGGGGSGGGQQIFFAEHVHLAQFEVLVSIFSTGRRNDKAEEALRRVPLLLRDVVKAIIRGFSFTDLPVRFPLPSYAGRFVTSGQLLSDVTRNGMAGLQPLLLAVASDLTGASIVTSTLKNVAEGTMSGLDRTAAGLRSGDLMGAAVGMSSIVSNTVSSVVGSAAGVTGAVGNVAQALAGNEGSAHNKKPTNVVSGMGKGLTEFGKGLFNGVAGLALKPMEGFEKGGFQGLATGAVQGIVGVVAAPVGGVVTGVTRVLQGVEGTLQSRDIAEARREEATRTRAKRAFYGVEAAIRSFSPVDAEWAARLRTLGGGTYARERLVFVESTLRDAGVAVLVTSKNLVVVRTVAPSGSGGGDGELVVVKSLPLVEVVRAEGASITDPALQLRTTSGSFVLKCRSPEQASALADVITAARHTLV